MNHTSHGEESASGVTDAVLEGCGILHLAAGSYIGAAPAPPNIAVQICTQATMTKMIAYCTRGDESIDKANRLGGRRTRGRYARLNELYAGSGEKKAILRKIASNREIASLRAQYQ